MRGKTAIMPIEIRENHTVLILGEINRSENQDVVQIRAQKKRCPRTDLRDSTVHHVDDRHNLFLSPTGFFFAEKRKIDPSYGLFPDS